MNTAISSPEARLPFPPIPAGLSHPAVAGNVPRQCPSTATSPAAATAARITYSITAIDTWTRAVSLIPATAITSMSAVMPVAIQISGHRPGAVTPATARTEGPMTSTPATAPVM